MHIKNKRGQSTVEYILLVTAVIAVMIVLVTSKNNGFQSQLNGALQQSANDMNSLAGTLSSSHQPQNAEAAAAAAANVTTPYFINVTQNVGT